MDYKHNFKENSIFHVSSLNLKEDFDSQVQQILQHIRLTRAEVEHLQLLFDDLQSTLETVWPGCQIHVFGSIVTGLGIKSSDVDCYISIPPWLQNPGESYVLRAKATLRRHSDKFKDLFAIVGANVPILTFYHAPTKMYCDISFKGIMAVENSKLVAYLLTLDNRVLPLAIIIKYWAKVYKLTEKNLMSNYTLILLIIFYLQQKAILPPIYHLQRNAENYVENWNIAFEDVMHVSGNNDDLYCLLGGFFEYYSKFDYSLYIVCPFLGRPLKRELFEKLKNVPSEFKLYQMNVKEQICQPFRLDSIVCVQDLFMHNKNCSVAMYPKLVDKFKTLINLSAEIFANESSELFLKGIFTLEVAEVPVTKKKTRVPRGITKIKPNADRIKFRKNIQKVFSKNKHKH